MFGKMMNSFYYGKSGKGDFRQEDLPKNRWELFWAMLRVRFASLCRLNLMTVLAHLPMIVLIGVCITQVFSALVVTGDYQYYLETGNAGNLTAEQITALEGADLNAAVTGALYQALSTFCLWAIPCIAITGPFKASVAYVTRNWARDEHAFIWSDFKDAVKANWKQALGVSAITSIMPLLIYVCWQFYGQMAANSMIYMVPQMLTLMLGVVWSLACEFMYPIIVTYEVKFTAVIKNGVMLAIARLPQSVGLRLLGLVPTLLAVLIFYLTGSLIPFLVLGGYYIVAGYALSQFVNASFTNGVFDKYINSRMEGVKVNRGLATETDDDEDEEEAGDDPALPPNP